VVIDICRDYSTTASCAPRVLILVFPSLLRQVSNPLFPACKCGLFLLKMLAI
jgi:hypothetical protein